MGEACSKLLKTKDKRNVIAILMSTVYRYLSAKLLQKSEMRKDIVIELSYRGFSRASDYS